MQSHLDDHNRQLASRPLPIHPTACSVRRSEPATSTPFIFPLLNSVLRAILPAWATSELGLLRELLLPNGHGRPAHWPDGRRRRKSRLVRGAGKPFPRCRHPQVPRRRSECTPCGALSTADQHVVLKRLRRFAPDVFMKINDVTLVRCSGPTVFRRLGSTPFFTQFCCLSSGVCLLLDVSCTTIFSPHPQKQPNLSEHRTCAW